MGLPLECSRLRGSHKKPTNTSSVPAREFVCQYSGCTKSYSKKAHLKAHNYIHTGEKHYVCTYPYAPGVLRGASLDSTPSICGERFTRSDALTRHRRRHEDLKPFVCSVCSLTFRRADHLRSHFHRHERNSLVRKRSDASTESPSNNTFTDTTVTSDQTSLPPANLTPESGQLLRSSKEFTDTPTSAPVRELGYFESASLLPSKPQSEQSTKMLTDAPSALSIRKFVCPYSGCEKSYMKRSYLRAHMCIHTGEKPYVCTYPCDSGGASSDSTPSICGERFGRSDELTRHRRRHEDLRPFVCSVCSRAFRRADHRRVHLRRHERDSLLKTRFAASTESPSENTSTDTPIVSDQRHPIKSNEEEDLPDVKQPVPNGKEFSQSTSSRPSTPSQTTTTSTAIPPLSCVLLTGTFVCLLPTDLLTNLIMSSVSAQLAQTVSNSPSPTTSHSTPTNHVDS